MVRASMAATLLALGRADLSKESLASVDPLAVCTDGSPAAYYYKPATEASRHTWLIYLQGGGWCSDEKSCSKRCPPGSKDALCSSTTYNNTLSKQGIFTPATNGELKNAHKVYVMYCTSDAHMGDGSAIWSGRKFDFRGQRVVQAVLHDLVGRKGLGSGVGGHRDRVIFGGFSAGARGAMVHLDYVKEDLGAAAAANVEVIGFLDSPAYLQMNASFPQYEQFPGQTERVVKTANVQHLGQECKEQHADALWKCAYGEYRLPTIQTPYFLVSSQYDAYFLGSHLNLTGCAPSGDLRVPVESQARCQDQIVYAEWFATAMRRLVQEVSGKSGVGVYSWACYNHAVSETEDGFNWKTCGLDSVTMDVAFKEYMAHMETDLVTKVFYEDGCGSFACGHGCDTSSTMTISPLPDEDQKAYSRTPAPAGLTPSLEHCRTCFSMCSPCRECTEGPHGYFAFGSCSKCWQCWDWEDDEPEDNDEECDALHKGHDWDDDEVQCLTLGAHQDCRACWAETFALI